MKKKHFHEIIYHPINEKFRIVETIGNLTGKRRFTIQRKYGWITGSWVNVTDSLCGVCKFKSFKRARKE